MKTILLAIALLSGMAMAADPSYPPAPTYMRGDRMSVSPDGEVVNTYDMGGGDSMTVTPEGTYNTYDMGGGDTMTVTPDGKVYNTYEY